MNLFLKRTTSLTIVRCKDVHSLLRAQTGHDNVGKNTVNSFIPKYMKIGFFTRVFLDGCTEPKDRDNGSLWRHRVGEERTREVGRNFGRGEETSRECGSVETKTRGRKENGVHFVTP